MSHFDDLYWLVEVLEAGTLSAAADKNNISSAAVSKRIKLLEDRLGVKLLVRGPRQVRATEAGDLYYKRGKVLLEAFSELEQNVSCTRETLTGTLRVNAPVSFGLTKLGEPVAHFMMQHPDMVIQMDLDDHYIDIQNHDYDLVIRIGKLESSSVIARRISSTRLCCCASPDYLKMYGEPQTPSDLLEHNCLIYDPGTPYQRWQFTHKGQTESVNISGKLVSNNGSLLARVASSGGGVGYLPEFIIESALKEGSVTQILPTYTTDSINVYALYPSRHYLPRKLNRFIEFLKEALDKPR